MQESKKKILSTRPVKETLIQEAAEQNIQLDIIPLIDTEPVLDIDTQQEIAQIALQYATVVFTSMNAVESVITMLDQQVPEWNIYCMGNTTQELIRNHFGEQAIRGTGNNASELAENILTDNDELDEVFFFCGDQRRDELPAKLTEAGVQVEEIVVYKTIPLYQKIDTVYDGILFFSPSAVQSFFHTNKAATATVFFAIGSTTEAAIKKYTNNSIITAHSPGKEELVRKAIHYFANGELSIVNS
ncbi:MAG: uroporphyrinogen-III synthase [Sediminibacterium sp.]|jgi:uroporphyrinogen-III synthase|uniref:uroporphyrinogen-III synthase n=1 Tax=Sediminibacterium sp. TaxID=1917865 RepID=UPI002AB80E02|nr:uroporphyrinogen-III synthase [Sediminibacterium sp.]MDZ4072819.1 uroporphyrinogen-III synthase [Sediminibacterium sp.]